MKHQGLHDLTAEQRCAISRLRQLETIERCLEFELANLQLYADGVAEERQALTKQLMHTKPDR